MPVGTTKGSYSKAVFVKNWTFWCSILTGVLAVITWILWMYMINNNLLGILGQCLTGVVFFAGPVLSLVCFVLCRILIDHIQVDHILYEDPEFTRPIKY